MANVPTDLRYTEDHEWARTASDTVRIGITDYAQKQLGDIVYVELPKKGDRFEATEPFGSVESVKAVTELYMPVTGTVTAVNEMLNDSPEDVNTDAYGDGWLIEVKVADRAQLDGLLDAKKYQAYCEAEAAG
ncbi:glycine cleavage system protein GcvH [Streptomyces sp. NBC_00820]|uniref:glycine cleavage system protein GcvH n=1 Tax=Streptomyces sp. NBC_00820 TaxID=2975842 RepID=UPI002ED2853E|nr:glycine cleavage system protein GcvH [Streptomyces sp. NBC_00820]